MKGDSDDGKKITALIQRLKKTYPKVQPPPQREPIAQLIVSFLQWESTTQKAADAYDRLMAMVVDHNDLRVSHPYEIIDQIGKGYPRAEDRVARLRQALQEIYLRERSVSLASLKGKPIKQVRAYLDTLPGMLPYVAAQVLLLTFGAHAIPVDGSLIRLLHKEGLGDREADNQKLQPLLERKIKASGSLQAHLLFQAWVDAKSRRSTRAKPTRRDAAPASRGTASPKKKASKAKRTVKKTTVKKGASLKKTKKRATKK